MTDKEMVYYLEYADITVGQKCKTKVAEAIEKALKILKQQPCETIKEIPKDYKYDTETEDFLVYRHKYTGHEIHIEKPVPRYRLEQQPCEDCISRKAVENITWEEPSYTDALNVLTEVREKVRELPSVTPQPKTGHWIEVTNGRGGHECDLCHEYAPSYKSGDEYLSKYCPNCGAKMEVEE